MSPSPALGRLATAAGLAAAAMIAVLSNLLAARHYERWDMTEAGLYTLSSATERTVSGLSDPIEMVVLLPESDPLVLTLRHLLEAYKGLSSKLSVRFIDPDRSPAEFLAAQQKYGILAGKTEDGEVMTDAAIVVARGERHHFITSNELIEVETGEELRARPQVERVLTAAIRQVLVGDPPNVCFSTGHGEPSLEEGGAEGLLALVGRLEKTNRKASALPPERDIHGSDPILGCRVVVVAAPARPLPQPEVQRLVDYVEGGGSVLVFAGPVPDEVEKGYLDVGLAPLLALAGVKKDADFVFELDASKRSAEGFGETFMVEPKSHPVTEALVASKGAIPVVLTVASSLQRIESAAVEPSPLLETSSQSFGMADFFSWAEHPSEPEPGPRDRRGPLVLAYAAELPKVRADAPHGPRLVIVGSSSAIYGANWQTDQLRGTALLVESAMSWLAAEPIVVDIPDKPARAVGLSITEDILRWSFIKLVLLLPLAALLIGVAITLRRRASEGRSRSRSATGTSA